MNGLNREMAWSDSKLQGSTLDGNLETGWEGIAMVHTLRMVTGTRVAVMR